MEYFAGLDVSLEETAICIIDERGRIVREARAASEPEALVAFFGECGLEMHRIGLEAGSDAPKVAKQIETLRPPDPIMRRPCADSEERRVSPREWLPTKEMRTSLTPTTPIREDS